MTTNFFRDLEKLVDRVDAHRHQAVVRDANSMKYFAEGDETFNFGEWKNWREACGDAGRTLSPEDFKKKKKVLE